jgi:hypothetical protein
MVSVEVADNKRLELVRDSRPHASGIHIAEYPRFSTSRATSPLWPAGSVSWVLVQIPTVPRSLSSDDGHSFITPD